MSASRTRDAMAESGKCFVWGVLFWIGMVRLRYGMGEPWVGWFDVGGSLLMLAISLSRVRRIVLDERAARGETR